MFDGFDEGFALSNWPNATETDQPLSDQAASIGFEDRNFANNMGSVFYVMLIYFLKVALLTIMVLFRWCCCNRCGERSQTCDGIIRKIKNSVFFNELISITIETYVEIVLAGFLTVSQPEFMIWGDYLLFGLSCFWLLAALVITPGILFYIRKKRAAALETDAY